MPKKNKEPFRYALEVLNLICEWEGCSVTVSEIEDLISHIIAEHLEKLHEDDLNCHWNDCEGFTENLAELRRHILLHAFHTKIKCHGQNLRIRKNMPDCALSIHSRNIIPELPEPLVCSWINCLEEFECPEYFYRHVEYHTDIESGKENDLFAICLWQDCNRKFADQYKLKEHLRSHTQEKLVACPTCGGMFASRTKFFDHIQRQLPVDENDPDNTFICEYCSKKMNSERLLRDHMRHHVNHYKCSYCDMTCPTPSALQIHVSYRHSDSKPHACQYCEYRCKSENDLGKHLETHSLIPSYKCPVEGCSYATRYQTCYTIHYRTKHEGKQAAKYSCHICEKRCTRGNYLTKHLISQHKFGWPSGHCRFRYRLHEDGLYRLQTVRYESLELSETMMPESAENVDDPDNEMNDVCDDIINKPELQCTDQSQVIDDNVIRNIDSTNSIPESVIMCVENGHEVQFQENTEVIDASVQTTFLQESEQEPALIKMTDSNVIKNSYCTGIPESLIMCVGDGHEVQLQESTEVADASMQTMFVQKSEQEPVLINIIDAEDRISESGGSLLLIKTIRPVSSDQKTAIQLITKDSSGRVIVEDAEIITQYNEL